MLESKNFPLLDSFEIEVSESWTEADIFKNDTKKITRLSEVGILYPTFFEYKYRDAQSVDLTGLFYSCYKQRLSEKSMFKSYVDIRKNPQGDDGKITRKITCRIKYKEEKSEV
jgi:hypothetical protein